MTRVFLALWTCAALWAGQEEEPRELLLLAKIKQKMKENLRQVPNYTCLETIERSVRMPRSLVISRDGGSGPFRPQDIVRLEVAEVEGKEFFARPGARNFEETRPWVFARGGMMGNGMFALLARAVFAGEIATYHFGGKENARGRDLLRYDFQVSYINSGYTIMTNLGQAIVAYHGSFRVDPQTLQAVRMDVRADDIPPGLGVSDATTRIDYARVRLGSSDVLLPQSAEQTFRQFSDYESRNRVEFTHCNQYAAESVISFDDQTAATAPVSRIELPAGLSLAIGLETPLDLEATQVGDLISGKVQADVKHKGRVAVPKGALVSGRVRRFEKYTGEAPYFVVGLEFSEVDFPGNRARFFAELEQITLPAGAERVAKMPTPHLPGEVDCFCKGWRASVGGRSANGLEDNALQRGGHNQRAPLTLDLFPLDAAAGAFDSRFNGGRLPGFEAAGYASASRRETAEQLRSQLDRGCSADVGDDQVDAFRANRVRRSGEQHRSNIGAAESGGGDIHRHWIDIASDHSPDAQQSRRNGQDSRSRADVEYSHVRKLILLEGFQA
jgi:hypothetical protein